MKWVYLFIGLLFMATLVTASDWVRPLAESVSLLWAEDANGIYYDLGKVSIGAEPSPFLAGNLEIFDSDASTELNIINTAGVGDAQLNFFVTAGTVPKWSICVDDSSGDALDFVMNGDCDSSEEMKITSNALQLSDASLIFKTTTFATGDTTPSVRSANVFITGSIAPTTITRLDHAENGQMLLIVCGESVTTVQDNADIYLDGDFICSTGDTLSLITIGRYPYEISRSSN